MSKFLDQHIWVQPVQAPWRQGLAVVSKAIKTGPNDSPPALLTYPMRDLQGDFLDPSGLTFNAFRSNPVVNWEHGIPVGRGRVEHKSIKLDGQNWVLPVGITTFFKSASDTAGLKLNRYDDNGNIVGTYSPTECAEIADQARELVCSKAIEGVSLEFRPIKSVPRGPSLARGPGGKAFDFLAADVMGWAHCAMPVNQGAQLLVEKAFSRLKSYHPVIRKSIQAAMDRRIAKAITKPTGGVIRQSPVTMIAPGGISVTLGYFRKHIAKAVPNPAYSQDIPGTDPKTYPQNGDQMPYDDDDQDLDQTMGGGLDNGSLGQMPFGQPDDQGMDQSDPTQHPVLEIRSLYNHVQQMNDLIGQLERDFATSGNPQLKGEVNQYLMQLRKTAAAVGARADAFAAELGPVPGDMTNAPTVSQMPQLDVGGDGMDTVPDEPDMTEDGQYMPKAFPHFKARRMLKTARRVRTSEVRPASTLNVPQGFEVVRSSDLQTLIQAASKLNQ